MDEATALLITLESTAPDAPTACAGWTAHDLVAHLAAGAAEMATHVERALAGEESLPTAAFADREAPFVALADDVLRTRLLTEALRLNAAVDALDAVDLSPAFSGRRMSAGELRRHGRSEAALHRWDLAGDDDIGQDLLGQAELTEHAVSVLNSMLSGSAEDPALRARHAGMTPEAARFVFAAPGQPDVVLRVDGGATRFELTDPGPAPTVTADTATRLLALWGRRSPDRPLTWQVGEPVARQFGAFLWPGARTDAPRADAAVRGPVEPLGEG